MNHLQLDAKRARGANFNRPPQTRRIAVMSAAVQLLLVAQLASPSCRHYIYLGRLELAQRKSAIRSREVLPAGKGGERDAWWSTLAQPEQCRPASVGVIPSCLSHTTHATEPSQLKATNVAEPWKQPAAQAPRGGHR
jgi:hypothetical protein